MARKETFYQVGICPNCPSQTRQQFLFATNDYMEPAMFPGKVPRYFIVRTLSLFRCEGCKSISLRETNLSEAQVLPKDDWVVDLSGDEFPHSSKLLYSTPKLDYLRINLQQLGLAYSDLPAEIRARFYRESPNLDPSA